MLATPQTEIQTTVEVVLLRVSLFSADGVLAFEMIS